MVLKEYFNFEKNISNKLFKITTFERFPDDNNFIIDEQNFKSLYILLNVGSILPLTIENKNIFCPAKDCLFGYGKSPIFNFNNNSYYKFILISLNEPFNQEIRTKILDFVDFPFCEIFKTNNYCFNFSLNIDLIELIEKMYKFCGSNENNNNSFYYLELESTVIYFLSNVLKIILFEDHKFNAITATPDLKFYLVLRKIITSNGQFEQLLQKYKEDKIDFVKSYRQYFPKENIIQI